MRKRVLLTITASLVIILVGGWVYNALSYRQVPVDGSPFVLQRGPSCDTGDLQLEVGDVRVHPFGSYQISVSARGQYNPDLGNWEYSDISYAATGSTAVLDLNSQGTTAIIFRRMKQRNGATIGESGRCYVVLSVKKPKS